MSALPEIKANYSSCYEDPLSTPGFPGDCYPADRDGDAAVPENVQQAKARFKAVYARRNVCARTLSRLQAADPERPRLVRQILFLTEAIDHLEDVYAPIGFIAEPVMDDTLFASELIFTHARPAGAKGQASESSFSLFIPIPFEEPEEEEGSNAT